MKKLFQSGKFIKFLFTGILITFLINSTFSQAYKVRMVMIGNSITFGATLTAPATESYPGQLKTMLSSVYGDTVEIKNYGVSARTMLKNADNPYWKEPYFKTALKYVPDIVLICLGTNDSRPFIWDAWGSEYLADYQSMIDTFRYRNPDTKFIVCKPTPIWAGHIYGTNFSNSHNDSVLVNQIIPLIDTVAKRNGAILMDFHTPFTDSLQLFPDKLHPNAEGQKQIASLLYDMIQEKDLIHEVQTGLAYVSDFGPAKTPVAEGAAVELKWSTIFADSAFLDGKSVDLTGSIKVTARNGDVYTLTAKGPKNTSVFPLVISTYIPERTTMKIFTATYDYTSGKPTELYITYYDQNKTAMTGSYGDISWSIISGRGTLRDQTDSSIIFQPDTIGSVIIEANDGIISKQTELAVTSLSTPVHNSQAQTLIVYPNPVKEALYFRTGDMKSSHITVRIYDLQGRQVLERKYDNPAQVLELNTSVLKSGTYEFGVYTGSRAEFGRFVK
jgi:acyl-CoA thioesterase I